jgi:hypothetical protein
VSQEALIGEMTNAYTILVGKPKGGHLEDLGVDGKIILGWTLMRVGGCGLDASGSG